MCGYIHIERYTDRCPKQMYPHTYEHQAPTTHLFTPAKILYIFVYIYSLYILLLLYIYIYYILYIYSLYIILYIFLYSSARILYIFVNNTALLIGYMESQRTKQKARHCAIC